MEDKTEVKVVRGFSLQPVNLRWLNLKMAEKIMAGERSSASDVLDHLVTVARLAEAQVKEKQKAKP